MSARTRTHQVLGLAGWLLCVFAVGATAAVASVDAAAFYAQLTRPAWAPPGSVFGPVWTVLYGLMAIAAWLVWRERANPGVTGALRLFLLQLGLNALWSWFFFSWRLGAAALGDVILLLALIVATLLAFWRIRRLAGLLLIPYLLWVCLATALTGSVWRLNPGLL